MKEVKNPLLTILFIFAGLFLYTKLFGPIPFSINSISTTKSNLFHVDGTGKAAEVPDAALLSLGVTKTASSVLDAQNQTNTTTNKIISDLKALGVEEKNIKTTNYSVYPNHEYSGRDVIKDYTVTQNLQVKVKPIEKVNKALDAATSDEANLIGGITFVLDDNAQKRLEDKARGEAVENAKQKAESLAKAAGLKLVRIVDVQESNGYYPRPYNMAALSEKQEGAQQPTQLTPGENSVQITVTLSYETY